MTGIIVAIIIDFRTIIAKKLILTNGATAVRKGKFRSRRSLFVSYEVLNVETYDWIPSLKIMVQRLEETMARTESRTPSNSVFAHGLLLITKGCSKH